MIAASNLCKTYLSDAGPVQALDSLDLTIHRSQFTAVMGPSGCGKSTLLNLLAGLDRPTSGSLEVAGVRPDKLSETALTEFRRRVVGVIFQFYNLLPTLSVRENIAVPALLAGESEREADRRARAATEAVGLLHRLNHRPHQLSGGEMQRAAIARALVNDAPVILADEPTGNLDSHAADQILELLRTLKDEREATVVLVTHDSHAAQIADRIVHLVDGRLERDDAPVAAG